MKLNLSVLDRPLGTRDEAADLAKDLDLKMAMSSFPLPSVQDVRIYYFSCMTFDFA